MDVDEIRFSRQLRLPGFDRAVQARLATVKVLVVGAGGLGAPVLTYLAAAGIDHLTIVDDDRVETSNLNRQVLFGPGDIGRHKAEVAADRLKTLNPTVRPTVRLERVTPMNAAALLGAHDIVLDCTDGLPSKYLLNDAAVAVGTPLVHGAVTAFDGRVLLVEPGVGPCLRCLFPALPPTGTVQTCQQIGVLGASVGVIGAAMAQQAILWRSATPPPRGVLHAFDLRTLAVRAMPVPRDPTCPACGATPDVDGTDPEDYRPPR